MTGNPTPDHDAETVAETRSYVLIGRSDGYAIWERSSDASHPVESFGAADEDLDEAMERLDRLEGMQRRVRVLTLLSWMAVVIGLVWILYTVVLFFVSIIVVATGSEYVYSAAIRLQGLWSAGWGLPDAFFVAVGLYVVVWMQLRSRRRGD